MFAHTRLHRRVGLFASLALVGLASSGCWFLWDDGPAEVTRDFWNAARDGNTEMVEALSVNRSGMDLDFDGRAHEIQSISIGDTDIDGDEAEVVTLIEGENDDIEITVEFKTALVKQDGEWYVEMEQTTGRLIGAFLAEMSTYIGDAIGEGISEAMEDMSDELADGLAEGMDNLSEALQEAAEEMRAAAEEARREQARRDRRDNR
ncbi:MAG: hypothetical protein R3195_06010 [Gemmatimonadota bacterium]|nr:hypothetical protein [Gemmatimonadota bacterium]